MTRKDRFRLMVEWFSKTMPSAETELHYSDPFQLLVAVILSAQCTDKRVNMITPALFEAYPTAESMSKATADDIFQYIKSCSYPNNKARNLAGAAARSSRISADRCLPTSTRSCRYPEWAARPPT